MALNCKFEELDDETRDYLQEVRSRRGRGAPGVYAPRGDRCAPSWRSSSARWSPSSLFFLALRSSKDAWAVALLQTAGLLIGGWCVLYAFRRWFAAGSDSYGGLLHLLRPAARLSGEGGNRDRHPAAAAASRGGGRPPGLVRHDGAEASVPVGSADKARLVEDYYAAMDELEKQEDGPWRTAPVAELGAAALMTAEDGKAPRKVEHLDLDLEKVPEGPSRGNRAGLGLLGLFLIPVAAVGLFLILTMINRPLGDDLAFDQAKADGAPGLRGYLLDDRNTRNRDEAKRLLAQQYDAPIAKLNGPPAAKNPELREGMVKLLEMLKTSETPAVAIAVSEDGAADAAATFRATEMRRDLADGVGPRASGRS